MPDIQQHIASLRARFTSGNEIPIERAMVPAAEAAAILAHIEALEADAVRLVDALKQAVDLAWTEDSHSVQFDSTVLFGPYYDFSGLAGCQRQEFFGQYDAVVWPGQKWSAYCTYEGSMWFEKFDTAEEAKEAVMRLLDSVLPEHPAMKARAAIDAARKEADRG